MTLLCKFFGHKFKTISITNYIDTSYNKRTPSVCVLSMCERCSKVKEQHLFGALYTMGSIHTGVAFEEEPIAKPQPVRQKPNLYVVKTPKKED